MSQPQTETPATSTPAAAAPAPAPEKEAPKETKSVNEKFADVKAKAKAPAPAAKPEAKAEPAKPAAKDPDVEAVERILRESERNKKEAKRLAEEKTAFAAEKEQDKTEREIARAVRAAREKGDVVGILKAHGFTDADIWQGDNSILFKLAEAKTKAPEVDQKTLLEAAVAEKLEEKEAAAKAEKEKTDKESKDKEAAEAAKVTELVGSAQERYSRSVAEIAAANREKYPTLIELGIPVKVVTDYAWHTLKNSNGETVLTEEQALADVEEHYRAKAKKAAGVSEPKKEEPPPRAHRGTSITPSWQAQTPSPAARGGGSLSDKFSALKQRARAANAK